MPSRAIRLFSLIILSGVLAACATELDLAAETIASKRELSAVIISGNHDSRVFKGWRSELVGEELKALL